MQTKSIDYSGSINIPKGGPRDDDSDDSSVIRDNENQAEGKDKKHYLDIDNKNVIPLWLAPCNTVAALFQLLQAVFLFTFSSQVNMKWLVYTNYPAVNDPFLGPNEYAKPDSHLVGKYSISWYTGIFILLNGLDHLICALPWTRKTYEYYVERHQNPVRWYEYGFSASLMRVLVAQLVGITDIHLLICIYFLTACMIWFGIMHEALNAKARADGFKQDWTPFWMSWVPQLVTWIIILVYFATNLSNGGKSSGFETACLFVLLVLDNGFAIVFVLQWWKIGPFNDFLIGEFAYIMLSFTAKSFLAWVSFAGAGKGR